MTNAANKARREYKRAWAKANPDKIKRYQAAYWARKAEQMQHREKGDSERDVCI